MYDKLKYFSYQSQESESVDAKAAHKICEKLGLTHKIYTISSDEILYFIYYLVEVQ